MVCEAQKCETQKLSDGTPELARLSDMSDFEIVDAEPDVRGWDIRTMDSQKIGEVCERSPDTAQKGLATPEITGRLADLTTGQWCTTRTLGGFSPKARCPSSLH